VFARFTADRNIPIYISTCCRTPQAFRAAAEVLRASSPRRNVRATPERMRDEARAFNMAPPDAPSGRVFEVPSKRLTLAPQRGKRATRARSRGASRSIRPCRAKSFAMSCRSPSASAATTARCSTAARAFETRQLEQRSRRHAPTQAIRPARKEKMSSTCQTRVNSSLASTRSIPFRGS
jgi:hypothetical protein